MLAIILSPVSGHLVNLSLTYSPFLQQLLREISGFSDKLAANIFTSH